MLRNKACFFVALAAFMVFAQSPVVADEYTNYALTGAIWNDGSSFSGSWTVNWTTNTITALNFVKGAGSYPGPYGGPSAASSFDMSGFPNILDISAFGAPAGVWEISLQSSDFSQELYFDFYKDTGAIYAGTDSLGSNIRVFPGGYLVGFYSGGSTGTSEATATPEPGTIFLLGSGLLGMAGFARKRMSVTLASRSVI